MKKRSAKRAPDNIPQANTFVCNLCDTVNPTNPCHTCMTMPQSEIIEKAHQKLSEMATLLISMLLEHGRPVTVSPERFIVCKDLRLTIDHFPDPDGVLSTKGCRLGVIK